MWKKNHSLNTFGGIKLLDKMPHSKCSLALLSFSVSFFKNCITLAILWVFRSQKTVLINGTAYSLNVEERKNKSRFNTFFCIFLLYENHVSAIKHITNGDARAFVTFCNTWYVASDVSILISLAIIYIASNVLNNYHFARYIGIYNIFAVGSCNESMIEDRPI